MAKLITIGDSLSQGFMSGAAARTDLSYSTLLAKSMGLTPATNASAAAAVGADTAYLHPDWPIGGLPLNMEVLSRRLIEKIGDKIDVWDWPRAANIVRGYIDEVEDYFERGDGRPDLPFGDLDGFHNLSVEGFDVADAWLVTPDVCRRAIEEAERQRPRDRLFAPPSEFFYRTALNVLNPARDPAKNDWSALDWLAHYATTEGVENLIIWLGANNALDPMVSLQVRATNDGRVMSGEVPSIDDIMVGGDRLAIRRQRKKHHNLWSPDDFEKEYRELFARVDAIMATNKYADWRVFVATVPAVTIAPIAAGVGESYAIEDQFGILEERGAQYFKYYTYFLFDYEFAHRHDCKLTFSQVKTIDSYIAAYRDAMTTIIDEANGALGRERYRRVDICEALLKAAFKRNWGKPCYDFPPATAAFYPEVDTRFHHATARGNLEQGGVFSLDGVHPGAIGQGLIAHEFRKEMNAARGDSVDELDWKAIFECDSLYLDPITLMQSIRSQAKIPARLIIWWLKKTGRYYRRPGNA